MKFYSRLVLLSVVISHIIGIDLANAATKAAHPSTKAPASKHQSLVEQLIQQLKISKTQAEGGAGAIFQQAKSKMEPGAFTLLSGSVPDMPALLAAAGNESDLSAAFQKLGLAADMRQKFVPIVMQYVHTTSGEAMASVLEAALMGGF